MQKSILISIQPQHVKNILSGKKTMELRKSVPKDFKGWVYIYCTKSKPLLTYDVFDWESGWQLYDSEDEFYSDKAFHVNGKVVARFWFDEYESLPFVKTTQGSYYECNFTHIEKSCMQNELLEKYGKGKDLYAWHIKKLEVFDKPMQLSDFYKDNIYSNGERITPHICLVPDDKKEDYESTQNDCLKSFEVKKAPQSWMYVYTNEQLP